MKKYRISPNEWYPVYEFDEDCLWPCMDIELTDEEYAAAKKVMADFQDMQQFLKDKAVEVEW
jgi:hypothetical protein